MENSAELQFKDEFLRRVVENVPTLTVNELQKIEQQLILSFAKYDVSFKEMGLTLRQNGTPEIVKVYIVNKKIVGLSARTLKLYLNTLNNFFAKITKPFTTLTTNDLRAYLYFYQEERKISNRSLDSIRTILHSFFTWCTDEGIITANPAHGLLPIKYNRNVRQYLEEHEVNMLLAIVDSMEVLRDQVLIRFLLASGVRVEECTNLMKEDIDLNNLRVHVRHGKGDKERYTLITNEVRDWIKLYWKTRTDNDPHAFVGRRVPHQGLTIAGIEKILRQYSEPMEMETGKHISPHVMRHTFATTLMHNGMPIANIQQLLGHAGINTTMIYTHISLKLTEDFYRDILG